MPVIVATARDAESEIVRLLDLGADDYVIKPFTAAQLTARIRAVLRRMGKTDEDPVISVGALVIDTRSYEVTVDGRPVDLARKEFELLLALARRAGEVVSHRELLARVWRDLVVDPSNLRVHINSLRRVLGQSHGGDSDDGDSNGKERYIANIVGQGYSFVAPVRRESASFEPPQLPEYPCGAARPSVKNQL